MTNEDIRTIAGTAYDGGKGAEDPAFAELDAQAQAMLFDSASAIVNFGGPTTVYEQAVAEAAAAYAPGEPEPPVRETKPAEEEVLLPPGTELTPAALAEAIRTLDERTGGGVKAGLAPRAGGVAAAEAKLKRDREAEKARIAAWKGAVTDEEKKRREKEEERLDKEEERIKKEKAGKNGPDKK